MRPVAPDAASTHISPYLTHHITHLGQVTLVPPENAGRIRSAIKHKKSRPNLSNAGKKIVKVVAPVRRPNSRPPRQEQEELDLNDEIPDYPPPSFEEAISTPQLSVCPSAATLVPAEQQDSDDDTSLEIVQVPDDRGRPPSREAKAKRRHLSLSPLRTLLPFSSRERTLSAHTSVYSRSTPGPFLRSTTSLKAMLPLSSSSSPTTPTSKPDFMSFFGKRARSDDAESLDSWEILEGEASTSAIDSSSPASSLPPHISAPASLCSSPLAVEQPWNADSLNQGHSLLQRALETPLPQTPIDIIHRPPVLPLSPVPETPTQARHHYRGRPLPQTPVSRVPVDSVYGGNVSALSSSNSLCPEGLLIDFDAPVAGQSASNQPADVTDLDIMVGGLEDQNARSGLDYDNLLLVSEILGPAQPPTTRADIMIPVVRQGRITVDRRRVLKDGRVKLKLSVLDVAVDKCGVCLRQFKEGETSAMGPECGHAFHDVCLEKWLRSSKTCPLCRIDLRWN